MRRILGWMAIVTLCCAAEAAAQHAGTDARLVEAQAAFDEAKQLLDAGKYTDGIQRGEHALELQQATLGATHLEVARSLELLGELYGQHGNFARAEPLLQRSLAIREAALGKDHPDVASSLNLLAELYFAQDSRSQAQLLCERALAIRDSQSSPWQEPSRRRFFAQYSRKFLFCAGTHA